MVIYDDDHYYLGGVIAELCRKNGCEVTLVTPAAVVSSWTAHTLEQEMIQSGLLEKGEPHRDGSEVIHFTIKLKNDAREEIRRLPRTKFGMNLVGRHGATASRILFRLVLGLSLAIWDRFLIKIVPWNPLVGCIVLAPVIMLPRHAQNYNFYDSFTCVRAQE